MTRPDPAAAVIDPLEPRRLYAATTATPDAVGVGFADGVLTVRGTDAADRISVVLTGHGRVVVTVDSGDEAGDDTMTAVGVTPRLGDVTNLVIDGGAGDDVILVAGLPVAASIHGGVGDDALTGGLGDDLLYGDAGRDTLFGYRGNDLLAGGAGGDFLRARFGLDTLLGQNGGDRFLSDTPESILNGGAGVDSATLRGVPDALAGIENYDANSYYFPALAAARTRGVASAYATGGSALLDASLNLYGPGYAVDWDMARVSSGGFVVDATPFLVNRAFVAAPLQSGNTYRHTFALGPVGGLDPLGTTVTLAAAGRTLYAGNAFAAGYGTAGIGTGLLTGGTADDRYYGPTGDAYTGPGTTNRDDTDRYFGVA